MKKFLSATFLAGMLLLPTTSFAAQNEIILPTVGAKTHEISVTEALQQRKSDRGFVEKDLTLAQTAKILWAANGINREDGKRVNPAGKGVYCVEVYAVTKEGIYLYEPARHKLKLIAEGDFRSVTTTGQSFVEKAAVNLVYVETPAVWEEMEKIPARDKQIFYANVMVGTMVQSVALAAESEGLGTCVRGSINREEFKKVAKLSDEKNILLAQSVGFIK